jgi:xanthine dehydrogenase molybdopterin-binding subunit B
MVNQVEVDVLSGDFTLLRADIIHDVVSPFTPNLKYTPGLSIAQPSKRQ